MKLYFGTPAKKKAFPPKEQPATNQPVPCGLCNVIPRYSHQENTQKSIEPITSTRWKEQHLDGMGDDMAGGGDLGKIEKQQQQQEDIIVYIYIYTDI